MIKILAAAAVLAVPAAVRAQAVNWGADPVAQLSTLPGAVVGAPSASEFGIKEVQAAPAPAAPVRLEGKPLRREVVIEYSDPERYDEMTWLVLNDAKDRVAVEFRSCSQRNGGDEPDACDDGKFLIEGLVVDLANKAIMHGDQKVARIGGFWTGIRLEKGWRIETTRRLEEGTYDDGFHKARKWRKLIVSVAIVR